jgi:hypothetical protein
MQTSGRRRHEPNRDRSTEGFRDRVGLKVAEVQAQPVVRKNLRVQRPDPVVAMPCWCLYGIPRPVTRTPGNPPHQLTSQPAVCARMGHPLGTAHC